MVSASLEAGQHGSIIFEDGQNDDNRCGCCQVVVFAPEALMERPRQAQTVIAELLHARGIGPVMMYSLSPVMTSDRLVPVHGRTPVSRIPVDRAVLISSHLVTVSEERVVVPIPATMPAANSRWQRNISEWREFLHQGMDRLYPYSAFCPLNADASAVFE